eukprot:jgi/Tetstr1/428489/TSEL_018500.t1
MPVPSSQQRSQSGGRDDGTTAVQHAQGRETIYAIGGVWQAGKTEEAGADPPEGTEGATEEGDADAIEEPSAATGGEGVIGDNGPQQDDREVTKLKGIVASLQTELAQQKSKTAAQLNKLKELHAHCGELVLTVEAEDSKWRKLYHTKQRNYNRLAERFGSTTTKPADAEEEAEREHEANEKLRENNSRVMAFARLVVASVSGEMRALMTVRLLLAPAVQRLMHQQMLEMGGKACAMDNLRSGSLGAALIEHASP